MKHGIKKIVYSLIYLLVYAHTDTHGMLKKQFEKLDSITKTNSFNYQSRTPPSPVSPISPGSYTPPKNLLTQGKKLNNSNIVICPAITKRAALRTMLDCWHAEKDPLALHKELDIYHVCLDILLDENRVFECIDFLTYIKKQNILLTTNNKKTVPRVIAWAALDGFLIDEKLTLEDIFNDKENLLRKLNTSVGTYKFPARYLNNQTGRLQPKKGKFPSALFLSPNKKLFATGNNSIYMQDIINPQNKQQLTLKAPKYSTTKIGDSVVFEPTGKCAVIYSPKGPITLWDITNSGNCIATLFDKPNEKRLVQNVLVSNGCQRTLIHFSDGSYILRSIEPNDLRNSITIKTVTTGNSIQRAALSPDGKLVAIDTIDNILWVNDYSENCKPDNNKTFPSCTKDTAIYSYIHTDKKISHLAFDPLSKYIAIITESLNKKANPHLIFCDLTKETNNQPILDWPLPESVSIMAFSAKGKYLALGYTNGFINICPVGKKDTNPLQLDLSFGSITDLTFDKDETSLFISTINGSVVILDVRSGEITGILKHKHAVVNGYFTNRWPLHGILAATNNRAIHLWGSQTFDVSIPTYLILRYLPPYQVISLDNPETAIEKGIWMANKTNIKKINSDLVKFGCALISVLVTKNEIVKEKIEEKNSELVTTKKPKQCLWLSDQTSRLFLGSEGQFLTGVSSILINNNWFDSDGKNSIN